MGMPSDGIRDLLVAAGIGVFASTAGWSIRISKEKDTPDTMIVIIDTTGLAPEPDLDINRPSVQVLVRGAQNGYQSLYAKSREVVDALLGLPSQTINGDVWASVTMPSDLIFLGYDEKDRPAFSLNFNLILHQGDLSNSHRRSC